MGNTGLPSKLALPTLKVLGGIDKPSASNGVIFNENYPKVAKTYIEQEGFNELAKRYAINIANGRYLWRNRVGAEKVEIIVDTGDGDKFTFNAKEFSLNNFETTNHDVQKLAGIFPIMCIARVFAKYRKKSLVMQIINEYNQKPIKNDWQGDLQNDT